jgi:hypothetical protein
MRHVERVMVTVPKLKVFVTGRVGIETEYRTAMASGAQPTA